MEFIDIVNEYGLVVVVIGLISSVLCGMIKTPIVRHIRSLGLGEKATSDRIRNVCTAIVAIFSIIGVSAYYCILAHSFSPLLNTSVYLEILGAITFSKIAYMLYEGVGVVSIKRGIRSLINKICSKAEDLPPEDKDSVTDWVNITQSVLIDTLHMPLTDNQKSVLEQALREQNDESKS